MVPPDPSKRTYKPGSHWNKPVRTNARRGAANVNDQWVDRTDQKVELLGTLTLNIVHERKNIHKRIPFKEVTNYGRAEGGEEVPDRWGTRPAKIERLYEYEWFLALLRDHCGYDDRIDYVFFHDMIVSPHIGGGPERIEAAWDCEMTWYDTLYLVSTAAFLVEPYGDIKILIKRKIQGDPDAPRRKIIFHRCDDPNAPWPNAPENPPENPYPPDIPTWDEIVDSKVPEREKEDQREQMGQGHSRRSSSDWSDLVRQRTGNTPPHTKLNPDNIEEYTRQVYEYQADNPAKKLREEDPDTPGTSASDQSEATYQRRSQRRQRRKEAEDEWYAKKGPFKFDPSKVKKKDSRLPRPSRTPSPASDGERHVRPSESESKASLAPPRRGTPPKPTKSAAARHQQSLASIKLQLIEDRAQYETEDAQDDDYGAIDQTVIDTYVGAYNTGDSDKAWDTCLSFFNIDPDEWARAEELRYKTAANAGAARKRVTMKKLPGMTVGLFDYQLIGVLNLLRNVLWNVPGGLLADEQGLGKTQEMFGLIALAYNLRRSKADVKAEWKSGKRAQHNPPQDAEKDGENAPRTCKTDERWGFRCYCYNGLTQMLADALPEGPNFIIGPERSAQQIYREGKSKLDNKVLKLRLEHEAAAPEERLTAREAKALSGKITAAGDDTFEYRANAGQSDYVIISHPGHLSKLTQGSFGVNVKTSAGTVIKKSAFLPGMVLMDEFHEFTSAAPQGHETRTVGWLKHLKQNHPPLVYFVSGTPFGDSPADIRAAIDMFDNPNFHSGVDERMSGTTVADFDELVATFDNLLERQNGGEALPMEELNAYRKLLNKFLGSMMVRRLGVDKFRGRNLTDIGPLSVKITDHPAPPSLISSLQELANATHEEVASQLPEGTTIGNFLRSQTGADLLLKLRLASTFPGISTPLSSDEEFSFTPSEIRSFLATAKGDLTKTPYYKHIPIWSAYSPKITTILASVQTMITDKSKIPGEATSTKKLIIFSPLEAESMLIYGFLLLKKQKDKNIKPVWINSVHMDQNDRGKVIDKFLVMGNAGPNILVAPMSLAGTGLNLQKAKYSIVTSPAWSKRENQQGYYRVHRVGQVQDTKLSLLTARWNPADRVVMKKYEGLPVVGEEDDIWGVGDEFATKGEDMGKGLVDRHQVFNEETK